MKTIQELKTRIKKLSKPAVEFSRKASEVCLSDRQPNILDNKQEKLANAVKY